MIKSSLYVPAGDTIISAWFLLIATCTGRSKQEVLALSSSGWAGAGGLWLVRAALDKDETQPEFISELRAAITPARPNREKTSNAQSRLISNLRGWK